MRDRICQPYEGCKGSGEHTDYTDSGSGATVYCECPAGEALRADDRVTFAHPKCPRCGFHHLHGGSSTVPCPRCGERFPEPFSTGERGWTRVGEKRMEECAPGIYVTAPGREMDPACRTALLYALGGPPWEARSPGEV